MVIHFSGGTIEAAVLAGRIGGRSILRYHLVFLRFAEGVREVPIRRSGGDASDVDVALIADAKIRMKPYRKFPTSWLFGILRSELSI